MTHVRKVTLAHFSLVMRSRFGATFLENGDITQERVNTLCTFLNHYRKAQQETEGFLGFYSERKVIFK